LFLQYLFYKQYYKLKTYANKKGISIIGDIPIYVAQDSVDLWIDSDVFMMSESKRPYFIAGVPPDDFSKDGQLWGNPLYDWEYLDHTSYKWWLERIKWSFELYDVVRIDHFRGFYEFWAVPYGSITAKNGQWLEAKGRELFHIVNNVLGDVKIIAEDLGIITESITKLRKDFGFPGMKVLQFAFDGNTENPYMPKYFETNAVAYTGTHDNDTLLGWFNKLTEDKKQFVRDCLNLDGAKSINLEIIKSLYESRADLCIIPLQDFLSIESEGRINTPSTIGDNWRWRVKDDLITKKLSNYIKEMVIEGNRLM
jgi:4-alpha-glucanotransferase